MLLKLLVQRMKKKSWFRSLLEFLYLNDILYNLELFEKNVGMSNFLILDAGLVF